MRTSNGCWTCKLRRKKCDEHHPVCHACETLDITCHNDQDDKPEWMDNGVKQQEMAEQVKLEVKHKARLRRKESPNSTEQLNGSSPKRPTTSRALEWGICPVSSILEPPPSAASDQGLENASRTQAPDDLYSNLGCMSSASDASQDVVIKSSDAALITFYLETLLPFIFPFYRPSHLQGGRSWVLAMLNKPVIRHIVLSQSSYFLSLTQGTGTGRDEAWEKVLVQTSETFEVLGKALQIIDGSSVAEHLHGAVRIHASIMQVLRFEIAVLSFRNWQPHLTAALALFEQILDSTTAPGGPGSNFDLVMSKLGHSSTLSRSDLGLQMPTAEQSAFRFSTALLLFDDVIASTVLQTEPRLYKYHANLLGTACDEHKSSIDVEAVLGVNNTIVRQIGEISALAAWKDQCKRSGTLDMMELVQHASIIKQVLQNQLSRLAFDQTTIPKQTTPLDTLAAPSFPRTAISRIWVHAALIYLSVVVSGWQPANADVRNNIQWVIDSLNGQIPPTLLPAMVWPFCVAGCMAEASQESHFRGMVASLQPPSIFGTVHKALEVMEKVWQTRGTERESASCFLLDGDSILLI